MLVRINMQPHKSNIQKEDILFLLIFVCAAALYFFNITFSEIWIDEAFTKALVRHPYSEFFKLVADDFHPPLYFLGLKLFTSAIGLTDFTIRLFSVIGALSTLIIAYAVGQRVLGKNGALYLLLLVVGPADVGRLHSQCQNVHLGRVRHNRRFPVCLPVSKNQQKSRLDPAGRLFPDGGIHALLWSHSCVLGRCIRAFVSVSWQKQVVAIVLAMGIAVFILYLPWFFVLISQTRAAQTNFWIPSVSPKTLLSCYLNPFGHESCFLSWLIRWPRLFTV